MQLVGAAGAGQRVDRWLCNVRFFKTRGLAVEAIDNGRVEINGVRAKAAKKRAEDALANLSPQEFASTDAVLVITRSSNFICGYAGGITCNGTATKFTAFIITILIHCFTKD